MEALVAVGLAGNVVQFVQFTGELISETISIRRTGSPSSLPDLRRLSEDLTQQANTIHECLKASNATLAREDQYLLDVAADCQKAGTDFLAYLDTLIPKPRSKSTSLDLIRSAGTSIKVKFMYHKIEDFSSKLDKLRGALTLAIILAFRASANTNHAEILAHLKGLQQVGQKQDGQEQDLDQEKLERARREAELRRTIQLLEDVIQGQAVKTFDDLQEQQKRLDDIQKQIQKGLKTVGSVRVGLPKTRERSILMWLNFRQMSWRFNEIPLAYQRTFQWIFEKPNVDDHWNDFRDYLTQTDVNAPYFINGKAGSGKSTLMKFIIDHLETKKALLQWADTGELLVVDFFFWNLGTLLQKSYVGMLRSIIHRILERYPELIPAVFPALYQDWSDTEIVDEPTYVEMKQAFRLLITKSASFLKLCLFIDGIDEFEGDHRDMAQYLHSLGSDNVKLVVSSRPINPCIHAFQGCPTLRLQDLTRHDMETYVRGELISHPSMIELIECFPQETCELVTELKDKAAGVFLWVKLVVQLLVDGLEAGDDMQDLQNKLRSLPPDLRDLYRRMIYKMTPEYRIQAAEIFELIHTWNSSIQGQTLRVILLYFAMRCPSEAFSLPTGSMDSNTFYQLCKRTEARIQSRCCGLLEVHKKGYNWLTSATSNINQTTTIPVDVREMEDWTVAYMHRTVAEFLISDDVWNEICGITKASGFSAVIRLASASLSMLKIAGNYLIPDRNHREHIDNTTTFCRKAYHLSTKTLGDYICTIDETMSHLNTPLQRQMLSGNRGVHWSAKLYPVTISSKETELSLYQSASILSFAARTGLFRYLKASDDLQTIYSHSDKLVMVMYALQSWVEENVRKEISLHDRRDTLLFLLQHVASPEDQGFGGTLLYHALNCCKSLHEEDDKAVLLASFITSSRSPDKVIQECRDHYPLTNLALLLRCNGDSETKRLGFRMEQLIQQISASDHLAEACQPAAITPGDGQLFREGTVQPPWRHGVMKNRHQKKKGDRRWPQPKYLTNYAIVMNSPDSMQPPLHPLSFSNDDMLISTHLDSHFIPPGPPPGPSNPNSWAWQNYDTLTYYLASGQIVPFHAQQPQMPIDPRNQYGDMSFMPGNTFG